MTNFYGQYIGFGAGGAITPYVFQGAVYGYAMGGGAGNVKDKWSFASGTQHAADADDLSVARNSFAGQKSATHGFASGGRSSGSASNIIDSFPFASDGNSTDHGNLLHTRDQAGDSSSATHGYTHGGQDGTTGGDTVDKFIMASSSDATDVGNLQQNRYGVHGNSSATHAYAAGGTWTGHSNNLHIIEKVPFASDGNATDVGDMTTSRGDRCGGNSSLTHGYHGGGHAGVAYTNVIDNHPFASDSGATDVGDLLSSKLGMAGASSITDAYWAGGSNTGMDTIEKNTFSSTGNSVDVGNLTVSVSPRAGTQV